MSGETKTEPAEVWWCHSCETFQLYADAVWLDGPYARGVAAHCVVCREQEPYGMGVWPMDGDDQLPCNVGHARRRESMYPGECDCPRPAHWTAPRVSTECRACNVRALWRLDVEDERGSEWTTLRAPEGCEHWPEHHTAAARAVGNRSGRSSSGPVRAHREPART